MTLSLCKDVFVNMHATSVYQLLPTASSGEGNAIGRVRPFPLHLLKQLTFDLDYFHVCGS